MGVTNTFRITLYSRFVFSRSQRIPNYVLFVLMQITFELHSVCVSNVFRVRFKCVPCAFQMRFVCVFRVRFKCVSCAFQMCSVCVSNVFRVRFKCVSNAFQMRFSCISNVFRVRFKCVPFVWSSLAFLTRFKSLFHSVALRSNENAFRLMTLTNTH
jgi:hypothetical protein